MAAAALAGPFLAVAHAQRNQPVYPAYDGFLKNPDGSYTLSFAYFSHNAEPVTIPPAPGNSFAPDPADRQQPTTFRPGHWRFQCIIVVGPEFDGKLRWTLTLCRNDDGHEPEHAAFQLQPRRRRGGAARDRLCQGPARRLSESGAHRSSPRPLRARPRRAADGVGRRRLRN